MKLNSQSTQYRRMNSKQIFFFKVKLAELVNRLMNFQNFNNIFFLKLFF
jgi:hypothetical protein